MWRPFAGRSYYFEGVIKSILLKQGEKVMATWLEEVEGLTLKGQIAVPYTWWVGEVGSRFLIALRDEKKILGNRCKNCNTVYVPPRKNCGRCFSDISEWVELGNEGVVTVHTIVRYHYSLQSLFSPLLRSFRKNQGLLPPHYQ